MRPRPVRRPRTRRPTRAQLWAALRTTEWLERLGLGLLLGLAGLVLVGGIATGADAWDGALAHVAGSSGTMTVVRCQGPTGRGGSTWTCTGTFAGPGETPGWPHGQPGVRPGRWRWRRDLNPRRSSPPHTLSRRAP